MNRGRTPPRALTIAGSDSGGGAGIQADLKTFAAWGVYGMSAITAVTAQNTRQIRDVEVMPAAMVGSQIDAVLEDIGCDAIKIGMLADEEIVMVVADRLHRHAGRPIVLDPVMVAKSGTALLTPDACRTLASRLLPQATLVTPNVPEAEVLLGCTLANLDARIAAARDLAKQGPAVLLKGGHAEGDEVEDVLALGGTVSVIRHPRVQTASTHGTGCTLSSAIAANLAHGRGLEAAVRRSIEYTSRAIANAFSLGNGNGPVNQFVTTQRSEEVG